MVSWLVRTWSVEKIRIGCIQPDCRQQRSPPADPAHIPVRNQTHCCCTFFQTYFE